MHLLFPKVCLLCECPLLSQEQTVCYRCLMQLEPARIIDFEDNEISRIFEGFIPISYGVVGFHYHKEGILQQLIFQLKYHHHKEIGQILGRKMGVFLQDMPFCSIDAIIPVPLHRKKERKRGYNQSEWIAKGLAEALGKELRTDILQRNAYTSSQTKKSRIQRFENMNNVFSVKESANVQGKHFLLVDDVVTTGSTLINCANALLQKDKTVKVSIACLAKADT